MFNDGKGANWLSKENAIKIRTTVLLCLLVAKQQKQLNNKMALPNGLCHFYINK
jgi:hypothetical protein